MDERRTKTLEALSTFIQSQRALLAQTLADIDRLKELRNEVASQPPDVGVDPHYIDKINASTSKLSDNVDSVTATLPGDFDWSVFASQDPAPFKALASSARQAYAQRNIPKEVPLSSPTPLQQYIREQKRLIIDPVIASLPVLSSDSEEELPDPEEIKKAQERQKIRDLKKRKINGFGGLGLRKLASDGVFIRMDVADESAEVDVWGGETPAPNGAGKVKMPTDETTVDIDPETFSNHGGKSWPPPEPEPTRPSRQRRPTQKAAAAAAESTKAQSSREKVKQRVLDDTEMDDAMDIDGETDEKPSNTEPLLDKKGKVRSETYKQAWSVSEQHLLEKLLEEIPDGEKNRWAKISRAMNGKRTPRQVASRVQKYYEKLKRFGVELGKP